MNALILIRLPEVLRLRGRRKTAHYSDIAAGLFTHPVSLGARAVGWPEHEAQAVNAARIAGKSETEIRALVASLEAQRGSLAA
ncbi:MAG: Prophage CP4-57 regulatory protein (AlpA) [Acidobacteria bacterium ADurb.Bin340]|nr:MAG: Prophage CP4-57 regulatory protein (AlpA) [Acidobacteria bacterium ADurb.Bin340]